MPNRNQRRSSNKNSNAGRPKNIVPADTTLGGDVFSGGDTHLGIPVVTHGQALVARSNNAWWQNFDGYLARLGPGNEDMTRELGKDVLDRMMDDPQISSSIYTLVLQAMSRGIRCKQRYTDRNHPFYQPAMQVYDFCSRLLDTYDADTQDLPDGMHSTLSSMAVSTLKYGHCAAEIEPRLQKGGPDSGKLVLARLAPKPPDVYSFVVNPNGRVPALACRLTTEETLIRNNSPVYGVWDDYCGETSANQLPPGWGLVPSSKFVVMRHRAKPGDPRGMPATRPAFNAWYLSCNLWPEFLKFLVQFASPSLLAILSEKARPTRDPNTGAVLDPYQIMENSLLNFRNGSYLIAPNGTVIQEMWSQGDGSAFIAAMSLLNMEKVKAIQHSTLTETSNHQTRAASSTGQDFVNLPSFGVKRIICEAIREHLFRRFVLWNFGPFAAQYLTPFASLGDVPQEDRAALMMSYAQMTQSGYLDESQLAASDAEMELEPRDELQFGPALRNMDKQAEAALEAAKHPASVAAPGAAKPANQGNPSGSTKN